jgi:rod shape-determining protein MreD
MIKTFFAIVLVIISTIIQVSFLPHFSIFNRTLNLVLLVVLFWNLYEDRTKMLGIFIATLGGLLLDIFSDGIIGYQISIYLVMVILIKEVLKKHVRIPFAKEI